MGIISDKDVNEAKEAIDLDFPYLKKDKKIRFVDAFYRAWKKSKKSKSELNFMQILQHLNEGIENNPENFGEAFGTLVGDIEADYKEPERLLQRNYFEWIDRCTNVIKNKPHFWTIVMKRLDKWKDKIKLEELTAEQRMNYGTLVANLK